MSEKKAVTNFDKNPIQNRPEDQKKGLEEAMKTRRMKDLNDVEFKRLIYTDRLAAMEYLAGDLSLKARQIVKKSGDMSAADVQAFRELRQTLETLEKYLGMRTEDELAHEFFIELEDRLQPAIDSLSLEELPKAIREQLADRGSTDPSDGSAGEAEADLQDSSA